MNTKKQPFISSMSVKELEDLELHFRKNIGCTFTGAADTSGFIIDFNKPGYQEMHDHVLYGDVRPVSMESLNLKQLEKPWYPYGYAGDKPPAAPKLDFLTLPDFQYILYDKEPPSRNGATGDDTYTVYGLIKRVNETFGLIEDTKWRLPKTNEISLVCKCEKLPPHLVNATYWCTTTAYGEIHLGTFTNDGSIVFDTNMKKQARVILVRDIN